MHCTVQRPYGYETSENGAFLCICNSTSQFSRGDGDLRFCTSRSRGGSSRCRCYRHTQYSRGHRRCGPRLSGNGVKESIVSYLISFRPCRASRCTDMLGTAYAPYVGHPLRHYFCRRRRSHGLHLYRRDTAHSRKERSPLADRYRIYSRYGGNGCKSLAVYIKAS